MAITITNLHTAIELSGISPNKAFSIEKSEIVSITKNEAESYIAITHTGSDKLEIPNPVKFKYSQVTSPSTSTLDELYVLLLSYIGIEAASTIPSDYDYLYITFSATDKPEQVDYYKGGTYDTATGTYVPMDATTLKFTTYIDYSGTDKAQAVYYKTY